ncbi:MAG TPA: hypothetical protein VGM19_05860 [Armatimonadota bacterium]|jgi:hypothetical protein
MKRTILILAALLLWGVGAACAQETTAAPAAAAARKPAVLFCCPGENRYEYVGYDYLKALAAQGFAVDYLEGSAELTWDRVKNFNVLVIYDFPAASQDDPTTYTSFAIQPPWRAEYFAVVDRFLKAGGSVFLHYCPFWGGVAPNDLLKQWGLQFPLIWLRDPQMQSLSNIPANVAYTNNIDKQSPVSQGVNAIWYPIDVHYAGAHTMPILVDGNWKPVVKAGATASTEIPHYDRGGTQPPPSALIPTAPIQDPVLFAIRDFPGGGRLAAIQTWYQFSIGAGMKWLYDNEVLSKGVAGRPSDYGKLLENTYRWLAEPSLKSGAVGGFETNLTRITEPQLRPGAMDQFHEWNYNETEILGYRHPPINGKIYRGLIGAQTALSGGQGTVADYAAAAVAAKLDFVVFLEDLANMTPEKLATLKADVAKNSTPTLKLYAGYRMKADTGNYVFVYGNNPVWPEGRVLTGPDQRTFNLQYQDENGKWAVGNPALDWSINNTIPAINCTVGYYNFTKSGAGLRMYDLRVYSAAAIRTYEAGKLVEDMTGEYLTTCQSTAVPTPISLNLVRSPAEFKAALASNQALTYGQARSLDLLWSDALRWNGSYDGMNTFLSDGPIILAWPKCDRVMAFGAEMFVSGRALNIAPVHVTSEVGLKEIRIYNGEKLYRRFDCAGSKDFEVNLFLPGVLQSSMVLIAEDLKGGKATSFALRSYKEGTRCPIFCSDHVNDCAGMLLSHGSHWPMFNLVPNVPNAGATWDGGPLPARPLLGNQFTYPRIVTDKGNYEVGTPYQVPYLEFSDEGASRCRMVSDRVLAKGVPEGNPWAGFGPLEPSPLVSLWASHTYFDQYLTGVEPNAYGAPGVNEGPIASLFTEQFKFKQDCTVNEMRLFFGGWRTKTAPRSTLLAMGQGNQISDVWDLTNTPEVAKRASIPTGGWFALFSSQMANTHLYLNRGKPMILEANPFTGYWLNLYADINKLPVKLGDTYDTEVFAQVWPLDEAMTDARTIAQMVDYLQNPTGMELTRGQRVAGLGGLLELTPDNYAVELSIPKPPGVTRTVAVRVAGFNPHWTVGLYQVEGYRTHYYSPANTGWRALGLDFDNRAYFPLFVSKAATTHVIAGHPIVADAAGTELVIQVTCINDGDAKTPPAWHVSINNPTDKPITTTLKQVMNLPGLTYAQEQVTVAPGEYRVLNKPAPPTAATAAPAAN